MKKDKVLALLTWLITTFYNEWRKHSKYPFLDASIRFTIACNVHWTFGVIVSKASNGCYLLKTKLKGVALFLKFVKFVMVFFLNSPTRINTSLYVVLCMENFWVIVPNASNNCCYLLKTNLKVVALFLFFFPVLWRCFNHLQESMYFRTSEKHTNLLKDLSYMRIGLSF